MESIVIVDDDTQLRQSFQKLLKEEGYDVRTAPTGELGIDEIAHESPDLLIMDVRLPGISGIEALKKVREKAPHLPVIIMTAFGTTDTAIEATKTGAFDYVLKPFEIPDILDLIRKAIEAGRLMKSRIEVDAGRPVDTPSEAIIGQSEQMREVYKAIGRSAPTDATVLIRGESGTGKELVARAIYQHSDRAGKTFLVINCVAIPETLLESELFGYEKGAFTGAVSRRVGKIEQANGGTVFLDEIGDMPLSIQAKILRLLQERSIERLGGDKQIPVDVRIIAATNRNLEEAISQGRFREDLYYRLKVVTINVPPLRERKDDLPQLCDYFMARHSKESGIENPGLTSKAVKTIKEYSWPGNVRELENAIRKALIFSRGYPLGPDDVAQAISISMSSGKEDSENIERSVRLWIKEMLGSDNDDNAFNSISGRFESMIVSEALDITAGNRSRAAKLLGLSRPTLQAKIEKHHISITTSVSDKS